MLWRLLKGMQNVQPGIGEREGGMNSNSTEDLKGSETILYDITMVETCVKPIERTTPRVKHNVNHRL